jgi:hypothetical protein
VPHNLPERERESERRNDENKFNTLKRKETKKKLKIKAKKFA